MFVVDKDQDAWLSLAYWLSNLFVNLQIHLIAIMLS